MLGQTTASLFELKSLHNTSYMCNGWGQDEKKSTFHRCHIQAHKGTDGSVGALHPINLFIGDGHTNQTYGNKLVSTDAGLKVPASKLKPEWQVSKQATNEQVAKKIRKFLGKEFTEYLSQSDAIVMNQVNSLAQRIYNKQQKGTAVQELDQRYTKTELESLQLETLEAMDAHQRGKDSVSKHQSERAARATLCVYADELERMANTSPSERQRDNCRFMLSLVRVLGMFIAQMDDQQGLAHKSFLPLGDVEWKPLSHFYLNWQRPWSKPTHQLIDADREFLVKNLTEHCFHALAGADIPQGLLRARLLKRLDVATLVPTVQAPDDWRFKAFGSWEKFIEGLYADAEPVWQALLHVGLCTSEQVEAARGGVLESLHTAIEKGRRVYMRQFRREVKGKVYPAWGFKGYPAYLEFPPVIAELLAPQGDASLPLAA
ncbi:hypothetical protein GUY40_05265 [Pseudomonas sp. R5(2019)]|nr:hypothetical protein [Pseudomonas sp. R5(2019)]